MPTTVQQPEQYSGAMLLCHSILTDVRRLVLQTYDEENARVKQVSPRRNDVKAQMEYSYSESWSPGSLTYRHPFQRERLSQSYPLKTTLNTLDVKCHWKRITPHTNPETFAALLNPMIGQIISKRISTDVPPSGITAITTRHRKRNHASSCQTCH